MSQTPAWPKIRPLCRSSITRSRVRPRPRHCRARASASGAGSVAGWARCRSGASVGCQLTRSASPTKRPRSVISTGRCWASRPMACRRPGRLASVSRSTSSPSGVSRSRLSRRATSSSSPLCTAPRSGPSSNSPRSRRSRNRRRSHWLIQCSPARQAATSSGGAMPYHSSSQPFCTWRSSRRSVSVWFRARPVAASTITNKAANSPSQRCQT